MPLPSNFSSSRDGAHPSYRAFYVFRAMQTKHLKDVSHLIERGVLHYFKEDFLSCALCLVPAAEGLLRSRLGWSLGGPKLKFDDLIAAVRAGVATSYPERHAAFADAITAFLDRWLFKPTKGADFELSFLNRHYALHGLGPQSFYRATDCHRLILFFDLFADLLTLEGHGETYVFIPDHIPEMNRRREHYENILADTGSLREHREVEESLLREHERFVVEANAPKLEDVVARWASIMGA